MSFEFLVEIDRVSPKYASRISSLNEDVMIYPTRDSEVVLTGTHRDPIYNYFIQKCQELDCTQFASSALATGAVSLCQECAEFIPRIKGGGPNGQPCPAFQRVLSFGSLGDNQNLRVTNSDSNTTLNSYNNFKNASYTNRQVSTSGHWLGIDSCVEGIWQCAVNCTTGNTTACWSIEGPSGTVFTDFGKVYNLGGQKYQIYDPLQIALAGIVPNGGTLPLVSSNPFLEINGQFPNLDDPENTFCGVPTTVFGGGSDSNCLKEEVPSCSCPSTESPYTVKPSTEQALFPTQVALVGDYTDKVLTVGDNCYNLSVDGNSQLVSGRYGLGGSNDIEPSTEEELGISGTSDACGICLGNIVSAGGGASCCQLACGGIVINGAPNWNGESWTPGSGSWNGFWPTHSEDQDYRNIEDGNHDDEKYFPESNRHIWHGADCTRQTSANSLYSVPCKYNPQTCSSGTNVNTVIEILDSSDTGTSCIDCTTVWSNGSCECITTDLGSGILTTTCGMTDPTGTACPTSIGYTSSCETKIARRIPVFGTECSECRNIPKNKCAAPCNIFVISKASGLENFRSQIISRVTEASGANNCVDNPLGLIQEVGCKSKVSISGPGIKTTDCSGQLIESCTSGTFSGFLEDSKLSLLIAKGKSSGQAPLGGSCCYDSASSPNNKYSRLECTAGSEESNWLNRKASDSDCKIFSNCA